MHRYADMHGTNFRSKARIAGHPIHPMLVHFPIALWLSGVLALLIGYGALGDLFWHRVASVGFLAGSAFAMVAAIPGTIDLFGAIKPGSVERVTGVKHMVLNLLAVVIFTAAGLLMQYSYEVALPSVLSVIGAIVVVVSGTLGSKLVHKEHVGQNISEYPLPRLR